MIGLDVIAVVQSQANPWYRHSRASRTVRERRMRAMSGGLVLAQPLTINGLRFRSLRSHDDGYAQAFLDQHARHIERIIAAARRRRRAILDPSLVRLPKGRRHARALPSPVAVHSRPCPANPRLGTWSPWRSRLHRRITSGSRRATNP